MALAAVFGRAVSGSFRQFAGINATAKSRTVSARCIAGKPPDASALIGVLRPTENVTLKRNANAGSDRIAIQELQQVHERRRPPPAARGHAARRFQKIFAIDRDAMNRFGPTPARRLAIAMAIVVRPHDASEIVNASG